MDDFEIASLFRIAVDVAVVAGWSDERIREELQAALDSAMEPER